MMGNKKIVHKSQIVFLLILLPFFTPRLMQQSSKVMSLQRVWLLCSIMYSVYLAAKLYRYAENRTLILLLIFLYELWTQIACYINNQFSIYSFLTEASYLALFIIVDYYIKRNLVASLSTISGICVVLIVVNLLSIIFNNTNYADTSGNIIYFWNTRNHLSSLFFLGMITCNLLWHTKKSKQIGKSLRWWITIILVFFSILFTMSSTTIVGILTFIFLLIFIRRFKIIYRPVMLMIFALVLHLAIVVFRIQNVISYLVTQVLGKDMTFTGRTDIWDVALISFLHNFWTGTGKSNTIPVWFSETGVSAHNQLLEIGMEFGVIGLMLFIILLISIAIKISKNRQQKADLIMFLAILSYVVMMITEVVSPYYPWFIIFALVSNIKLINEKYISQKYHFRISDKTITRRRR